MYVEGLGGPCVVLPTPWRCRKDPRHIVETMQTLLRNDTKVTWYANNWVLHTIDSCSVRHNDELLLTHVDCYDGLVAI